MYVFLLYLPCISPCQAPSDNVWI